jgi:hypothetical protein
MEKYKKDVKGRGKGFKIAALIWLIAGTLLLIGGFRYNTLYSDRFGTGLYFLNTLLAYLAAIGFYLNSKKHLRKSI